MGRGGEQSERPEHGEEEEAPVGGSELATYSWGGPRADSSNPA